VSFGCSISRKFFGQGYGTATQLKHVLSVRLADGVWGSEQCCGGLTAVVCGARKPETVNALNMVMLDGVD